MTSKSNSAFRNADVKFAILVLGTVMMMFVPLSPIILDILLSLSITSSLLIVLVAIYINEPLEFSTFPTLLLLTTLARLSLNVATTRSILLDGGSNDVSSVIVAFGEFVVGGNYVVGFVIFLILVTINFFVITKGAGRVAEVGARFTLDAMPGKQMSIDAELNAGLIDRSEAKSRRSKIEREADFYGAMDGASKFVRGDAIASVIITGINIVVGLTIGVFAKDMSLADAAATYTLLTVGDGLVSQIPAITISVAAGIVVTRASSEGGLSNTIASQMFLNAKALYICAILILLLAVLPGLPSLTLLPLGVVFVVLGRFAAKEERKTAAEHLLAEKKEAESKNRGDDLETLLHIDAMALEVGVGLVPLVDKKQDGEVLERIVSSRKQFAQDMGVIVPMIMVRDNVQLKPGSYQILLKGNVVASGSILVDHELAMNPDNCDAIEGIKTKEPAYNLDALWIKKAQREEASFKGYTVVNPATVIVTHLSRVIQDHCHELIGRQEVQNLVDTLKSKAPKVVEEAMGTDGLSLGIIVQVLKLLLVEGVSIRDFLTIFETLADLSKTTKNPELLVRHVRKSLGRGMVKKLLGLAEELPIASLDRGLEDAIAVNIKSGDDGSLALDLDPEMAQNLLNRVAESLGKFNDIGSVPIIVCGAKLRWSLKKLLNRFIPGINVLAFDEIPGDIRTNHVTTISF